MASLWWVEVPPPGPNTARNPYRAPSPAPPAAEGLALQVVRGKRWGPAARNIESKQTNPGTQTPLTYRSSFFALL